MGANDFEEETWIRYTTDAKQVKTNLREGFDYLVDKAEKYHGHQEGYSGAINTKSSFVLIGSYTKSQYEKIKKGVSLLENKEYYASRIAGLTNDLKKIGRATKPEDKEKKKNITAEIRKYSKLTQAKAPEEAIQFKRLSDKNCDDKWGPACAVIIHNDTMIRKEDKIVGFSFSPLKKNEKPFIVFGCDEYKRSLSFVTLNDAKKHIQSNKGTKFCINPSINKITHTVGVDQNKKKIDQKYMKAIFFGWAPS